jgi:DNA-directed RNA polymerase specialized sigma subunit
LKIKNKQVVEGGALNQLLTGILQICSRINNSQTQDVIREHLAASMGKKYQLAEYIFDRVSQYSGIGINALKNNKNGRLPGRTNAVKLTCFFLYYRSDLSMKLIGEYFDLTQSVVSRYIKDVTNISPDNTVTDDDVFICNGKIQIAKEIIDYIKVEEN